MERVEVMGLAEAAQKLRIPYQDCHRLLLTGALRGEKVRGRWYVEVSDVNRLAERTKHGIEHAELAG
jgi:hypothetical protein